MQVDRKAEHPVTQTDLDIIAKTLQGREVQEGVPGLPKATFVFGPEDGVRRGIIVTPDFYNPNRFGVVHNAMANQGGGDRDAIEGAWIEAIDHKQGTITFANNVGQNMSIDRASGQVTFTEPPVSMGK